jgi:predicted 3-demethylubiquinone-9 3-methyltransferase (glyoxalase superfamily)
MTIAFQLDGQDFSALNGGPHFRFNEAISLVVNCQSQAEVDHFWARLSEGGDPSAQQCGWLKDRYGVSWQVVPTLLSQLLSDPDPRRGARKLMPKMKKIDIALQRRRRVTPSAANEPGGLPRPPPARGARRGPGARQSCR